MTQNSEFHDPHDHDRMGEGEEAPPPFVKTMAAVRWLILGTLSLFALVMILSYFGLTPWANASSTSKQYHCPMHPTYVSSQPGDCPICGMSLVEIDAGGHEVAAHEESMDDSVGTSKNESKAMPGQYTCPMDPEVVSDSAGRCPKCGMHLEQVPAVAGKYTCPMDPEVVSNVPGKCPKCGMNLEQVLAVGEKYTCPMHPEVISDGPGECPKCGMNLVPMGMDSDSEVGHSDHVEDHTGNLGSAPVPGLVPVTIEPQRLQLIGVRTEKVGLQSLDQKLRLVGYLTPDETRISTVYLRIDGWVQQLFVNETGQEVREGQPLVSIYSQQLYEAEQNLVQASSIASQSSDDSLLSTTRRELLNAATERLRLLGVPEEELKTILMRGSATPILTLKSPFSGVVLEKSVFEGGFISPNQNLFTIADLSTVWILADVYEMDISSIRLGADAGVSVDAYPGEVFPGKIDYFYPTVSEKTRTGKVRIVLRNPEIRLQPGMYATVQIRNGGNKALAISSEALMDGGEVQYAFVVHGGTHFEPRQVKIGRRSDDWVEVISGLQEGEAVVSSANFLIDSESRLKAAIAGMGSTKQDAHAGHGR